MVSVAMLGWVLVSGGLATGHPAEPMVSYQTTGASVEKVLGELTVKTGIQFAASPRTKNEILAIRVESVPVKELTDRIAWAVGGSWKQEGGVQRLVQTDAEIVAERKRDFASKVDHYRSVIAKLKSETRKPLRNSPRLASVVRLLLHAGA